MFRSSVHHPMMALRICKSGAQGAKPAPQMVKNITLRVFNNPCVAGYTRSSGSLVVLPSPISGSRFSSSLDPASRAVFSFSS